MTRTVALRALSSRMHSVQARLMQLAANAERLGFARTIGPGLRESARQLGIYRLVADAVADVERDPRVNLRNVRILR